MWRHDLHTRCPGKSVQMLQQEKNGNFSEKRGQLKHGRLYTPQQHHVPSAAPHADRISSTRDLGVHIAALGQRKHKINSEVTIHSSKAYTLWSSHLQVKQCFDTTIWHSFAIMSDPQEPHFCWLWSVRQQLKIAGTLHAHITPPFSPQAHPPCPSHPFFPFLDVQCGWSLRQEHQVGVGGTVGMIAQLMHSRDEGADMFAFTLEHISQQKCMKCCWRPGQLGKLTSQGCRQLLGGCLLPARDASRVHPALLDIWVKVRFNQIWRKDPRASP